MAQELTGKMAGEVEVSSALNQFMYLNIQDPAFEGRSIKVVLEVIKDMPEYKQPDGSLAAEYQTMVDIVNSNPHIGAMKITNQSGCMVGSNGQPYNSGTFVNTFLSEDGNDVYVAYRGTSTGEWIDNGKGMVLDSTTQQEEALDYFNQAMEAIGITDSQNLIVCGHSKGGNKSQYVTVTSPYNRYIDKCYSLYGQGFSEAFINKQKMLSEKNFQEAIDKMYTIAGENDYVNGLGNRIIRDDHVIYLSTPVVDNVAMYHSLRFAYNNGEFYGTTEQGMLSKFVDELYRNVSFLDDHTKMHVCTGIMGALDLFMNGCTVGLNGEYASMADYCAALYSTLHIGVYSGLDLLLTETVNYVGTEIKNRVDSAISSAQTSFDAFYDRQSQKLAENLCSAFKDGNIAEMVTGMMIFGFGQGMLEVGNFVMDDCLPLLGNLLESGVNLVSDGIDLLTDAGGWLLSQYVGYKWHKYEWQIHLVFGIAKVCYDGCSYCVTAVKGLIGSIAKFYDKRSIGGRVRDFTTDAYNKLIGFCGEVQPDGTFWSSAADWFGDCGLEIKEFCGFSNINNCLNNISSYHKEMIDKDDVSAKQIEQIFTNVYGVESTYSSKFAANLEELKKVSANIVILTEAISSVGSIA